MKKVLSFVLALCIMVSSAVSASAAAKDFSDVPAGKWSYKAVCYAREAGHMVGVGNNKFDPRGSLTIAQLSQVLYNMAGRPRYMLGYRNDDAAVIAEKFTSSAAKVQEWVAWVDSIEPDARNGSKWEPRVVDFSSQSFVKDALGAGYGYGFGENPLKSMTGKEWYAKAYVWAREFRLVNPQKGAGVKATRADVVAGLSRLGEDSRNDRGVEELVEDENHTKVMQMYGYTGGEPDWESLIAAAEADGQGYERMIKILRRHISIGWSVLVDGKVYRVSTNYPDCSYLLDEYSGIDRNDVSVGLWHIAWAIDNHILVGDGTHSADGRKNLKLGNNVTREEFAQLLYNYDRYAA